ncbi:MAG: SDR family oxidoreductase [Proteobacteria bacterium]|nr:SDR family oxidoreductase [Pseudomonadota bacterium]
MSKVILVTGSSRGIGAKTAIRLAADGYDICVNYSHDAIAAENVVREVQSRGRSALAVQADVSKERDVQSLFTKIDESFDGLYGLVNNAGILFRQMRVEEMTAERINAVLTTNVTGYFLCAREAIKRMSKNRGGMGGVIVNVSSAAARTGSAGEYVDYAASKGAIDTMTIGLANEVAVEGIRVNGVRPGFIYTDMHRDGGEPGRVDRLKDCLPMKRGGTTEEVAAAIAWLVSEESSYTTGSFIEVAGGR